ncbi:MAG: riboflavin synthase [Flavobacteriales bacterium]|jgi:riboflavin synthase|nr:MAG: riboflavin synthase [Flavobacteriales bacterium TMED96]RZP11757.1 MAG: riboflavin synthase [Flavobacteriales bacterium]|tara:strand:+ start:3583 stop:4170 length:588 start_codon:yes stop_codon:yes gene_type:complete
MFTGIIEDLGILKKIEKEKGNINLYFKSKLTQELKIDQSLSHNGVCLTVVSIDNDIYKVTAVKETLDKSNLGGLKVNSIVNLERAMKSNARLDGHYVQGHVDQIAKCLNVRETDGSWYYEFQYDNTSNNITIEKGSIAVNGVSLTVVNSKLDGFSVAVIPYTYNNTNFKKIQKGDNVNIEFDMIGKYITKLIHNR